LTNAKETEEEQGNQLAQYLGIPPQEFSLDSTFVTKAPNNADPQAQINPDNHPLLRFYTRLALVGLRTSIPTPHVPPPL
jgi:hypothetical protein